MIHIAELGPHPGFEAYDALVFDPGRSGLGIGQFQTAGTDNGGYLARIHLVARRHGRGDDAQHIGRHRGGAVIGNANGPRSGGQQQFVGPLAADDHIGLDIDQVAGEQPHCRGIQDRIAHHDGLRIVELAIGRALGSVFRCGLHQAESIANTGNALGEFVQAVIGHRAEHKGAESGAQQVLGVQVKGVFRSDLGQLRGQHQIEAADPGLAAVVAAHPGALEGGLQTSAAAADAQLAAVSDHGHGTGVGPFVEHTFRRAHHIEMGLVEHGPVFPHGGAIPQGLA